MRLKFFLAAFSLAFLACSPLFSEKGVELTQAEYTQIVQNMMSAQKALTESENALERQEEQLRTLGSQLRSQSEYCARLRQGQRNRLVLTGALFFCLGVVGGTLAVGALSP